MLNLYHCWDNRYKHSCTFKQTHSSSHENGCPGSLEVVESSLAVTLAAISVDACGGIALGIEEVIKSITALLCLNKDECESVWAWGVEKVKKKRALVALFHPDHFLGDVLTGGTNSANGKKDVIVEKVSSQYLQQKMSVSSHNCHSLSVALTTRNKLPNMHYELCSETCKHVSSDLYVRWASIRILSARALLTLANACVWSTCMYMYM